MGRRLLGTALLVGASLVVAWWLLPGARAPRDAAAPSRPETRQTAIRPPRLVGAPRHASDGSPAALVETHPTRLVRGRVVDEGGAGVAGATVVCCQYGPPVPVFGDAPPTGTSGLVEWAGEKTTSGRDGSFALHHPPTWSRGAVYLRACEGDGWSRSPAVRVPSTDRLLLLHVSRRPTIEGAVLLPDGQPATGTRVRADWEDPHGVAVTLDATTDGAGSFALRLPEGVETCDLGCGLPEGEATPSAMGVGFRLPGLALPRRDLVLTLLPPAFLQGTTVGDDGRPVPAVRLVAIGRREDGSSGVRLRAGSSGTGSFRVGPMRPGTTWRLVALPHGKACTYSTTEATAPSRGLRVRLSPPLVLSGRVLGEDVSGFEVDWTLRPGPEGPRVGAVRTGPDGTFRIGGLPSEPVRLFVRRIGDPRYALLEGVLPRPDPIDVTLVPGLEVQGSCEGYSGRVIAHQGDLHHEGRAKDGRFLIEGLPPGPWVLLKVAGSEGKGWAMEWETGPPTETEAGTHGVVLR